MKSFTFLVSPGHAEPTASIVDIEQAHEELRDKAQQDRVEVLVYNWQSKLTTNNKYFRVLHSKQPTVTDFQNAVVSSAGEWVICVSAVTFVEQGARILQEVSGASDKLCLLPTVVGPINALLGIRTVVSAPYFAIKKAYAVSLIPKSPDIYKLIRSADNDLRLTMTLNSQVKTTHPVIADATFIRPYATIAHRSIKRIKTRAVEYYDKQRAERLSRNVLRVKYSSDIPVFIICRDRLAPLKKLVEWLEEEGLKNIYFIDNASTYKPLLEYLDATPYTAIKLNMNAGHTAPWSEGIVQLYAADKPFIVTDPDVIPSPNSHGAVKLFADLLNRHLERRKVGFGLRIDNLPDHYELKEHVISWEEQFWVSRVEDDVYDAEIDTTFALYRPHTPYVMGPGLRTGGKYTAEHEPWYINSSDVPKEARYYRDHADKTIGSWGMSSDDVSQVYIKNKNRQA